jgi:hypothetical protein
MVYFFLQMVRNYCKKTNRQEWSIDSMNTAIQAVLNKEMGYYKASKQFNVPQTTLERHVRKKVEDPNYEINKKGGSKFQCVFSKEQEEELVDYLLGMESRLFGLNMKDLRSLAFQLANRNNLSHQFNSDNNLAGKDWVKGFLSRHPTLTIREPEATSGARAMGFNKVAVDQFFTLLEASIDKHKFEGDRIYNCDETGITVNPKSHSKIIALRGKRQVGTITSSERGETVTGLVCMSAGGAYMPPMLIFPRKRKQKEFELGLPPGGWAEVSDSGWITSELFLAWLHKFIAFSKASKQSPVLLIFDGHSTHTKSLEVIDLARENGVVLLCLPPHTSHRLQPLDLTFFRPLSVYYGDELRKWLRCNPGKVVTLWQISSIFGFAFVQAATMSTALKGFEKTGIWPPNKNIFCEADFLPADTTDVREQPITTGTQNKESQPTEPFISSQNTEDLNLDLMTEAAPSGSDPHIDPIPGCSWMSGAGAGKKSSFQVASPENVLPIPKSNSMKRSNRKKGKTVIITESPYKNELQAEKQKREEKIKAKEERARMKLFKEDKNEEKKDKAQKKQKKRKLQENIHEIKGKKLKKKMQPETEESNEDDDDAQCLYCGYFYSKSNEGWISCVRCKNWAHNSCANVDSEDDEAVLICKDCHSD